MIYIEQNKEGVSIDILPLDSYEDFDTIIEYLEKYYDTHIIKELDGPDMRICKLTIDKKKFTLHNNPYSNTLSTSLEGKFLIEKITSDLNKRLYSSND